MEDIEAGCEGAVAAMKGWIDALATGDFEYLEKVLADDFLFTCDPKFNGGQIRKSEFIEMDKNIKSADIRFVGLTARRMGKMVITQVFANVREEFKGELGPNMPSAAEMKSFMENKTMAYASAWREADGQWQCFDHHFFGPVE